MSTTLTSLDQKLRDSVMRQLAWDPSFDASMIGVSACEGIVTLSGYVDTFAAKLAAERAVRRVYGVRAVANDLVVRLAQERVDPDLAKDALDALKNRIGVPPGLDVTVRDGHITLTGTVEWMDQKNSAQRAVKYLKGVRGVNNHIEVKPRLTPKDIQNRITEALHHHADIDARRIHVETEGRTVALSGSVRSWVERKEAERAAWCAPGVATVKNQIAVVP